MSMPATPTPQFNMLLEPSSRAGYDSTSQHILTKMSDGFASAAQDSHSLSNEIASATAATAATFDRGMLASREATDRVGLSVLSATERNGSDTRIAVERTSANGMAVTERNGGDTRASVYQGIQGVLSSSERNGGDTRTALSQAQGFISAAVERNGGDSRVAYQQGFNQLGSAVERNGGDTRAAVQQGYGQVASAVERNGGDSRTAIAQSQGYLSSAVERNGGDTRAAVVDARSQLAGDITDTRSLLRSDITAVGSAVALSAAATNVQVAAAGRDQLLSAKDILISQLQVKSDLMQFNAGAFAQARSDTFQTKSELAMQLKEAELEALKSEARLSKQMAECCCEIKEKVDARATITDVLVKDNETSRLKDDLYYARDKYLSRRRDRSHSPHRGRDGRDGRDSRRRSPSPEARRG